ncbi:MAG: hypothetical protein CMJ78_22965 [Planctomycetaceae bacterium]|nr:hypothetical protein [Planctomycetaceae bacterium]
MLSSAAHSGPKGYAVSKAARVVESMPVEASAVEVSDSEVLDLRANFEDRSPLDELIREGARRMLQSAIEAEVDDFIAGHAQLTDEHGRRRVVRNGSLPEREILTGAGKLAVRQRNTPHESGHDVQAGRIRLKEMEQTSRRRADHPGHPGTTIH